MTGGEKSNNEEAAGYSLEEREMMRIKEDKELYEMIFRCYGCGTCVGRWAEERCSRYARRGFSAASARGLVHMCQELLEGRLSPSQELAEYIFNDPLCRNCEDKCPLGVEWSRISIALRQDLIDLGYGPLDSHKVLVESVINYDNPWMQPRAAKERWAKRLDLKDLTREKAEVLYYVGCTAALDPNIRETAELTARIFTRGGVDFGVLGREEHCCGSTMMRIGYKVDVFKRLAKENIDFLNALGVKEVVTSCAGCYSTLKEAYPKVKTMDFEVLHTVELLERLLREGKVKFTKRLEIKVTYHDPCHLGRYCGLYDAPREILRALPGVEFVEMERIRKDSFCCGAGAGVKTAFPDYATKTAVERLKEAETTGADILVTACPFCENNFSDALKAMDTKLEMKDILKLVMDAMD